MAKRKTAQKPAFAKYTVNTHRGLNVRSGPGLEHPVLRVLQPGEEVEAAGKSRKGWLPVQDGWVDKQYLQEV